MTEYHSLKIGTKHTYDDWQLIPSSRPSFVSAKPKRSIIDIPGGNGALDCSTALTGYPVYSNREGSFEFVVLNDYAEWTERYSEICNYLDGSIRQCIMDDDPTYYYDGSFWVSDWKSEAANSVITISYSVFPYKKKILSSTDDPLTSAKTKNIVIASSDYVQHDIIGIITKLPVCPTFKVTSGTVDMHFINTEIGIDVTKTITNSDITFSDIMMTNVKNNNENQLFLKGSGTMSILYRNGVL